MEKYYWDMFNPGWPSQGFNAFYTAHLLEERQTTPPRPTLRRLLVAITKRCPLQCAHCSEAATLYQKDIMTVDQYIAKIDPFVRGGIGQIVYSGGEPLSRLDDMLEVIHHYKDGCDQWILHLCLWTYGKRCFPIKESRFGRSSNKLGSLR